MKLVSTLRSYHRAVVCLPTLVLPLLHLACQAPAPPPLDSSPMNPQAEAPAIREALHAHLGRNTPGRAIDLEVAQVGVDSGYALVTWAHEKQAGQAVLRKVDGVWTVLECSDGWLGLRGVCAQQVPEPVAQRLLDQVDPKWGSYETP